MKRGDVCAVRWAIVHFGLVRGSGVPELWARPLRATRPSSY